MLLMAALAMAGTSSIGTCSNDRISYQVDWKGVGGMHGQSLARKLL